MPDAPGRNMMATKYYQGITDAQRLQKPVDELPPFDAERLRTTKLTGKIASRFLENPRWFFGLLRRFKPTVKLGPLVLVSRNADVREVLERQDVFETPFGLEMEEMAGGTNFILGMQDGEAYRRMKSAVLSAFPIDEIEEKVRPIAARHARNIMLHATSGFDIVDKILKIVPVRICRDYYGLVIDDEIAFADRAIALSSIFFADPFGSAATRDLAVVAASDFRQMIERSIKAVREGQTSPDTPLGRLVGMVDRKHDPLPVDHLHSIVMGMVSGFTPTNVLAAGNCLDVVLRNRDAQDAIERAIVKEDNELLDRAIVEAMRFKPINAGAFRYANRDFVIAEGTSRAYRIKAGSTLVPMTWSAMFDDEAIKNPKAFDPTRPASDYMVFGHGIHWCIGANLAKIQIAEAFRAIFSKRNVRRAPGKAGRLKRRGAFPESLCIDFEMPLDSTAVTQSMATMCFPVRNSVDLADLRNEVAMLGNPCFGELCENLDETGVVHFASMAVIGAGKTSGPSDLHPAQIVLEMSADGNPETAIRTFALATQGHLRPIFRRACNLDDGVSIEQFLKEHHVEFSPSFLHNAGLAFAGAPGHSIHRIRKEADLAKSIGGMIRDIGNAGPRHAAGILKAVRRKLSDEGHSDWAFQPADSLLEKPPGSVGAAVTGTILSPTVMALSAIILIGGVVLNYLYVLGGSSGNWISAILTTAAAIGLTILGLVILAAVIAGAAIYAIRRLEKRDKICDQQIGLERYEEILKRENHGQQNHLTGISVIKEGFLRRTALRLVFMVIAIAARVVFRPGMLSDINTIHFARWIVLPGTDKLLFFSNYGGSWESYLEDFITKARQGLTGVWSNTLDFPPAKYLFGEGAKNGDLFKRWARRQQSPTLFWYSAYPGINTQRIRIHSAVRQGLAQANTESEARDWLNLFGSLPRPDHILETDEIQSILFGPMGDLKHSELFGITVPAGISGRKRKKMLEWLEKTVSFGDRKPAGNAMIAAFGPNGLARLGLGERLGRDAMSGFPPSFRQGMDHGARSRLLDDDGPNAPAKWRWGNKNNPVDLVLICYGRTTSELTALTKQLEKEVKDAGLGVGTRVPMGGKPRNGPAKEHFGFVDGVSQPLIKGTAKALGTVPQQHVVEPGELILGYKDQRQYFPLSPVVPAWADPLSLLPAPAGGHGKPADGESDPAVRDFGRNGSYLVVRQFEQHVSGFHTFCRDAANKLNKDGHSGFNVTAGWIAAKMVGRWQDGTSLVRNRYGEKDRTIDNAFTYGAEDPQGTHCPLGSHIRRSNPRDSLGEDRERQIELTKRHRILRVGRRYEYTPAGEKSREKGLMFMCLNTDIERQFEFIQQTWVSASAFHGLDTERDPLVGDPQKNDQFTIPTESGGLTVSGLRNFTTLHGGGYFFMPGRGAIRFLRSQF